MITGHGAQILSLRPAAFRVSGPIPQLEQCMVKHPQPLSESIVKEVYMSKKKMLWIMKSYSTF